MPLLDSEAFVLRTYSVQEADKVCVFFTRKAGKLRGVARGARKLKSRYGASLEPFTEVSLAYFQKENKELVSVSNCDIIRSQFAQNLSSEKLGALHYLAELVNEFLPDHEPNDLVYRLIGATLEALRDASNEKLPALVRYFEIWMLKLAGFFPDWRRCGVCERDLNRESNVWLNNEAIPQCADCSQQRGQQLTNAEWRTMYGILTTSPAKFVESSNAAMNAAGQGRTPLTEIGQVATELIARVLERELKSYEVLDRLKPVDGGQWAVGSSAS